MITTAKENAACIDGFRSRPRGVPSWHGAGSVSGSAPDLMAGGCRRGVILPVVLLVLVLLGLLVAMFSFRVNADVAATRAVSLRLQTRLAAEAGVDRVKLLLREARLDPARLYRNFDELHRIIVWSSGGDRTELGTNDEFDDGRIAFRFSIVADDPTDDEKRIRIGVTDESAKLNLNVATPRQLLTLVRASVGSDPEIDPQSVVDAIIDWRDSDSVPSGTQTDTEGEYYKTLPKPYRVKNGPFDTVEELLLVKGVTGRIFYGEDFDRNGLLTPNEDDGDLSFPPDDQDGKLNRGLYPYLTVWSKENNVGNDNRPRVYLFGDAGAVQLVGQGTLESELERIFPDEPSIVEYIVTAARSRPKGVAVPPDDAESSDDGSGGNDNRADNNGNDSDNEDNQNAQDDAANGDENQDGGEGDVGNGNESGDGNGDAEANEGDGRTDDGTAGANNDGEGQGDGTKPDSNGPPPIYSPASLMRTIMVNDQPQPNPLEPADLAMLMDRTTTVSPDSGPIVGLININTAPPLVLRALGGLTDEQIGQIVERRDRLSADTLATTAWLVTEGVLEIEAFDRIAPFLTARGQQFTIESLGYADHVGMVTRLQVIVDMSGPIAQTIYYRDVTYLGGHFPIRQEDLEEIRVR